MTSRQFLWSATIPNGLRLTREQNVTQVGTLNFTAFTASLQDRFLNPADGHNLASLLSYDSQISAYYQTIFEDDICGFSEYTAAQKATCKGYLEGKLQGGINSVFTYYPTLDQTRYL